MARVTVEDCILKEPNRFDLVMISGQRARQLASGAPLTVDRDNDKNAVVALREIAEETVNLKNLREAVVKNYQTTIEPDYLEEDQEQFTLEDTEIPAIESTLSVEEFKQEFADEGILEKGFTEDVADDA